MSRLVELNQNISYLPASREHSYNAQLLKAEIDLLEKMDVKYVGLSHSGHFIQNKDSLVLLHKQIYSRRKDNDPVIKVEDYFN